MPRNAKKAPGRPRVLDRARQVNVILDEATDSAAREAAQILGVTLSQFIRDEILIGAMRVKLRGPKAKRRRAQK